MPAPSLVLGRILEAIANAGLFRQGVVLIGTAAYQAYACPLGAYLGAAATLTNGIDLLVVSFVARGEPQDIEAILKRADPAEALPDMDYLAEESMEAVALYGAGVVVRVPPAPRYAMHKLLIARKRGGRFLAKRAKDLAQANELIDILLETDEVALLDALDSIRVRGPAWRKAIEASLRELRRDDRKGHPPLPVRQGAVG